MFCSRLAAPAVLLLAVASGNRAAGQTVDSFPIPTSASQPFDIKAGPDGNLWFTESNADRIGRITTAGVVTEFQLPAAGGQPAFPNYIASGPDGNLWFTELLGNKIGRITTAGVVTEFPVPTQDSGPIGIAAGPDGNLWFAERAGVGKIGRITPAGVITEFRVPTVASSPNGMALGSDGNLWFAELLANQIGRITPAGVVTEFPIPTANSHFISISAGPDGNLWFAEKDSSKIGRITPGGAITEFPTPTNAELDGIGPGPDGSIWFTEGSVDKIGRITPAGVITEFTTPTAGGPLGITAGPDGNVWFTEINGSIGRLVTGVAESSIVLGNGRFRVNAIWQSSTGSGLGHGIALTSDTGYFWFFDSANVELIVKVLDGCTLNGNKWVFAGGLTNVNVLLSVTDLTTQTVRTYVNPQGFAFQPIQDTSAFSTCP
jgi:streptogramin lyase